MKVVFKITVHVAAQPLNVPDVDTSTKIGEAVDVQVPFSGGDGAVTFAPAADAVLPPGLSLSASGELTGVPTQTGDFSFNAEATDSKG